MENLTFEIAKFAQPCEDDNFKNLANKLTKFCGSSQALKDYPSVLSFPFTLTSKTEPQFRQIQKEALEAGYIVVECKNFESLANQVMLFPTADKYAVMLALGCDGGGQGEDAVIDALQEIEKKNPFVLVHCANDLIAGYFTQPIKDPMQLAEQLADLCEDIDFEDSTMEDYAKELSEKRELYLWWD